MSELALNGGNVSGLIDNVSAHGMPGVMWGVTLHPGQLTNLIPDGVYDPGIQPAVSIGGRA